jgi:hypothetical protein
VEVMTTILIVFVEGFSFLYSTVILVINNRLRYRIIKSLNSLGEVFNRELILVLFNFSSVSVTSDTRILILISYYVEETLSLFKPSIP